ncbi:OLC1v1012528C1 [Oldenlandia corymbosa var. corymbosa]|uniref:OLC1v1012528C1 n=1 Tax=Oldenlandia corymbosa var. corymbosa TaxID=529605 RepID=A0AAV1DZP0_OLDCO|nr:OLC1v1012528C1 [Oldenlandia corymbosa var. corymbosa]
MATNNRRKRRNNGSPTKTRPGIQTSPETTVRNSSFSPPRSTSVVERDVIITDELAAFENLGISSYPTSSNPRSFPYSVKQQCWEKADKIKGRDPDRWRRDPLGNMVFRKLVGCPGCLCHDYDHIIPYSKGGQSTLENCQVLQATVNRSKGNRTEFTKTELIQKSAYCRVQDRDMDLLELSAYGNVRRGQDSGRCFFQGTEAVKNCEVTQDCYIVCPPRTTTVSCVNHICICDGHIPPATAADRTTIQVGEHT